MSDTKGGGSTPNKNQTVMLGIFLGTARVSGELHALVAGLL